MSIEVKMHLIHWKKKKKSYDINNKKFKKDKSIGTEK